MANSERIYFGNVVEVSEGVNPAGSLLLKNVASVNPSNNRTGIESAIINEQYGTKVLYAGNKASDLTTDVELIYAGYDEELRSLFKNNYTTALNVSSTALSAAASDNSLNGTGLFTNAVAGQMIRVAGFTGAGVTANNGYARIASKPSNDKIILAGITLVDDAAGETVTVKGQMMVPGTTPVFLWNEYKNAEDTLYKLGRSLVSSASFSLGLDAMISGSFTHVVQSWASATDTAFSGTTAASTNLPTDTVNSIRKIWIDDAVTTDILTTVDFTAENGAALYFGLGNASAQKMYPYGLKVNGNISEYQTSNTLSTKQEAGTAFSLGMIIEDPSGNAMGFHFPNCRLLNAGVSVPGQRGIITQNFSFGCYANPTLGYIMAITKIPA